MLNILKKKQVTTKASYPKVVQEIHKEFLTAGDILLKEANDILDSVVLKDSDKVDRLSNLGFRQVKQVEEVREFQKISVLSQETKNLILKYKIKYPKYKFINEEQVEAICHKYNLVCGDVSRFKGFVPEKNLKEIESFKGIENEDTLISGTCWGGIKLGREKIPFEISYNEYKLIKRELIGKDKHKSILNSSSNDRWINSSIASNVLEKEVPGEYFDRIGTEPLKICAPIKDMDISGLELKEGYKLVKKFIPDPVVLKPIMGGYLILTAWGDEASDDLVVNEVMN